MILGLELRWRRARLFITRAFSQIRGGLCEERLILHTDNGSRDLSRIAMNENALVDNLQKREFEEGPQWVL